MRANLELCPKDMLYGPCGGVGDGGVCETGTHRCVFLDESTVRWPAAADRTLDRPAGSGPDGAPDRTWVSTRAGREIVDLMDRRPVVITGLPAAPMDVESLRRCAGILAGSADAVLSGDSGRARVQFPPSYRARLIRREGLRPWLGVNCRDRNRVALEGELAALHDADVAGVHCVTGDHTDLGDRPDAKPVFDLEGTQLVPLARELGLLTSIAESPASPPVERRSARVAEKARAGAQLCLPQYAGDEDAIARFIEANRAAGASIPVLPGVPLIIDAEGAVVLRSFAAAILPHGYIESVLGARDPYRAGVEAAVSFAQRQLGLDGVSGVVVAGGATIGQEERYASALAEVARALGGGQG